MSSLGLTSTITFDFILTGKKKAKLCVIDTVTLQTKHSGDNGLAITIDKDTTFGSLPSVFAPTKDIILIVGNFGSSYREVAFNINNKGEIYNTTMFQLDHAYVASHGYNIGYETIN